MIVLIPFKLLDSFPIINYNIYIFKETEDRFKLFFPILRNYEIYINRPAVKILKLCNGSHKVKDIVSFFERKHKGITNSEETIVSFLHNLSLMKIISFSESKTRHRGKLFLRVIRATPHLESVLLYVTNSCNLNCIHCCVNASKRVKNELSTNEAKHLINDLSYAGVYELAISGGEPLMRVDFFDICSYAKHKIPSLILFTNGTLIDEEKAKKIADINFSEVAVSLYGSSSISHEFITNVQGSFNRTIEGIIRLTSNGINVKINVVVSEHNANELENITKLAVELKAKSIIFSPVDKVGRAIINWRKFGDQEKTLRNIFLFLKKRSYGV